MDLWIEVRNPSRGDMTPCDQTRRISMESKIPHLDKHDIVVGIDLASSGHVVVILSAQGQRLTRFKVPHSLEGLQELVRLSAPENYGHVDAKAMFAFEATGHLWPSVAHFLCRHELEYRIVNPLATFRVREARQMSKEKSDLTDAEQIADLLRTGMVTKTQLESQPYVEIRRTWSEYDRMKRERAKLKTLVKHQLYGLFPEILTVWKDIFTSGALAVLRLGLTPRQIASLSPGKLYKEARQASRGRRLWRFKILQVHRWAQKTVSAPHGSEAMALEIKRIVERVDLLSDQIETASQDLEKLLEQFEEARYLSTMPGIHLATVAGLIAQIGDIRKYRHGRQLIKLAGINPGRRQTGNRAGKTAMTRRGRADLRSMVYMATVSSIQHNPRLKAHYDRLCQRREQPLTKMRALGACMTKFLLYAFAVMKRRQPFDVDHRWEARPSPA